MTNPQVPTDEALPPGLELRCTQSSSQPMRLFDQDDRYQHSIDKLLYQDFMITYTLDNLERRTGKMQLKRAE